MIDSKRKPRILLAKPGLDGHDRGVKVVALALKDAGFEVIYTGLRQSVDAIVNAAIQEDVDCIGLSILSGSHMDLLPQIQALLQQRGLSHVLLVGGGIIPPDDCAQLEEGGFARIFGPGTSTGEIAEFIVQAVGDRT